MRARSVRTLRRLGQAMLKGGLPNLQVLDLRQNVLGDEGAVFLAQHMLAGAYRAIVEIYVQANQMRDTGVSALYKAVTAAAAGDWFPHLEAVNARMNDATPKLVGSLGMGKIPVKFQV